MTIGSARNQERSAEHVDVLVCGAQLPFTSGGAELHQQNLVTALTNAGHRAELVRLPVAWEKGRVFDAALAWRLVPIDADVVIATNFPSYYVRHPRKVVWLFHQHRGAYELADEDWSDIGIDDTSLEVQRMLAEWDTRALGEADHLYATSRTVADRLARFNGLSAQPLYHPPPLHDRLTPGPFGDRLLPYSAGAEQASPARCRRGGAFFLWGRHAPSSQDVAVCGTNSQLRQRQPVLPNTSTCSDSYPTTS